MKSLTQFILESFGDPVENEIEPTIVFKGFDLEKINQALDGAGELGLQYFTVDDILVCRKEDDYRNLFSIEPNSSHEYYLLTDYQWVYDVVSELGYTNITIS